MPCDSVHFLHRAPFFAARRPCPDRTVGWDMSTVGVLRPDLPRPDDMSAGRLGAMSTRRPAGVPLRVPSGFMRPYGGAPQRGRRTGRPGGGVRPRNWRRPRRRCRPREGGLPPPARAVAPVALDPERVAEVVPAGADLASLAPVDDAELRVGRDPHVRAPGWGRGDVHVEPVGRQVRAGGEGAAPTAARNRVPLVPGPLARGTERGSTCHTWLTWNGRWWSKVAATPLRPRPGSRPCPAHGSAMACELARRGGFPCRLLRYGGTYRVVTAELLELLGVPLPTRGASARVESTW